MLKEAIIFTIGCCVLVINAVLCFLPFLNTRLHFPTSVVLIEGILSVLSCSLFLTGSFFTFLEVVRTKRVDDDVHKQQWRLQHPSHTLSTEAILEKGEGIATPNTPDDLSVHYPSNHATLIDHLRQVALDRSSPDSTDSSEPTLIGSFTRQPSWLAVSTAHGLNPSKHFFDLRLFAGAIFLASSFLYWTFSIVALYMVFDHGVIDRWVRYPQLVAAFGFTAASTMLMIKTQTVWWRPAFRKLGWHINFWNLVGSAGFMFCAVFGIADYVYWENFSFGCSYLWGSWSFLLAAGIQSYKAMHRSKHDFHDDEKDYEDD